MAQSIDDADHATADRSLLGTNSYRRRFWLWFGVSLLAAGVLSLALSLIPARARLLLLFAVGEGCLSGMVLGSLARAFRLANRRRLMLAGALAGCLAFGVTSGRWAAQYEASVRAEYALPFGQLLALQQKQAASKGNLTPDATQTLQDLRANVVQDEERESKLRARSSFTAWLIFRLWHEKSERALETRWLSAAAFWMGELLAAGIACGWLLSKQVRDPYCEHCQQWLHPIRSQKFAAASSVITTLIRDVAPSASAIEITVLKCDCETRRPAVLATVIDAQQRTATARFIDLDDAQFAQLMQAIDIAQGLQGT